MLRNVTDREPLPAERAAVRRQRELERERKQQNKLAELEHARHVVDTYENLLERMTTLHHDFPEPIDWAGLLEAPEPREPKEVTHRQEQARKVFDEYIPGFLSGFSDSSNGAGRG